MNIVVPRPAHMDALHAIYLQATTEVSHCRFAPSVAQFGAALIRLLPARTTPYVAEEHGTPQGVAALMDTGFGSDGMRQVTLSALFVARETAGQVLLDTCIAHARRMQARRFVAFSVSHHRCPVPAYNGGWDGLSDRMGMAGRLLARNGFVPFHRELHLECTAERFPTHQTPVPDAITVKAQTTERGRLSLGALAAGQQIGNCTYSTLAALSDNPLAARWGYIWGLYVAPDWRRQGIARHLLIAALAHLRDQGCAGCWLTTGADNWAAQSLYLSLGFEIVDTSASYYKELDGR